MEELKQRIVKLEKELVHYQNEMDLCRHGHEYDRMEANWEDVHRELTAAKKELQELQ